MCRRVRCSRLRARRECAFARATGRLFYDRGARLERRDQDCREDSRRAQRHSRSAAGHGTDRVTLKKGNRIMSTTNTVKLHRVLKATPERVYKAFLDADAMAKWLPPNGFTGKVHQLDAKAGGTYKMSFTNFTTGKSHSFGGTYLELTPYTRISHTDQFDDPNLPGQMQTTITLREVFCGTELNITQEGIPA